MLCPKCKHNHKKNDGMYCKCRYRFVFRPDVDNGMTDNKFMLILRKASSDGRYYFTFPQLYYFCCTVKGKISFYGIVAKYIFFGFFAVVLLKVPLVLIAAVALMHSIHSIMYYCDRKESTNQEEFRKMVRKWSNIKGVPDKMLVKPSLHHPPPEFQENDIYDYGVERIIIVERQLLVDLLVKNGFHTDQRALIFSANGYPSYIAERAKILLKASPTLPIYLLHDATEEGMSMRKKITLPGQAVTAILPELKGMTDDRPSFTAKKKKRKKLHGDFYEEISGMDNFDLLHESVEDGMTAIQKKIRQPVRTVLDLGIFPEQIKNLPALKPLRLKHQEYQAPLDVLPYVTLSGLTAAAIASNIPLDEVIENRKEDDNYG